MGRDYRQFFAICKALGLEKEALILEFTKGKNHRLSSLTNGEWTELMIQLRKKQPVVFKPGDAQRKKLIAIAGKMNWGTNTLEIVGRLNGFLQNRYGKELNELEVSELNKIVWVFENNIYKDYLKRV